MTDASSPSSILSRAADLIRDTAAKTTKPRKVHFGWGYLEPDELGDASNGTVVVSSGWGGVDVRSGSASRCCGLPTP